MHTELKRAAATVTLLATLIVPAAAPANAADPDLQIESVKLFTSPNGQVNDRVIEIIIVNTGDEDSPRPSARLAIIGGRVNFNEDKEEQLLDVPQLKANGGRFQGFAGLAGPCDGTTVRLSVVATGDGNLENNELGPVKLCPDQPILSTDPGKAYLALPLAYTRIQDLGGLRGDEGQVRVFDYDFRTGDLPIGWGQRDDGTWFVSDLAVQFDYAKLRDITADLIGRAAIAYTESGVRWTNAAGVPETKLSCVDRISRATVPWSSPQTPGMIETAEARFTNPAQREIDVTDEIKAQLAQPNDRSLGNGYLLEGAVESLTGKDQTSCYSALHRDLELRVWVLAP